MLESQNMVNHAQISTSVFFSAKLFDLIVYSNVCWNVYSNVYFNVCKLFRPD